MNLADYITGSAQAAHRQCAEASMPHPMHTPCGWFAAKTQGAI